MYIHVHVLIISTVKRVEFQLFELTISCSSLSSPLNALLVMTRVPAGTPGRIGNQNKAFMITGTSPLLVY